MPTAQYIPAAHAAFHKHVKTQADKHYDTMARILGKQRHVILKPEHLDSLGINVPPPLKNEKGKVIEKHHVFLFSSGSYTRHVKAVTQEQADAHNEQVDAFNEKLEDAKRAARLDPAKLPAALKEFFPTTWDSLKRSGLAVDKDRVREQSALEVAKLPCSHPVTAILPLAHIQPHEAYDEQVDKPNYAVDGSLAQIGVASSFKLGHSHEPVDPHFDSSGKVFVGSELLQSVWLPQLSDGVIGGGHLANPLPCNPRFIDGARCAKALEMYSQFRVSSMLFEYFTQCGTLQGGAGEMVYVDDSTDNFTDEVGFAALRDGYTRPGNTEFSFWENANCRLHFPQQKWYYTGGQDVPGLEIPGMLELRSMNNINAPDVDTPLGAQAMHYKFDVRSASTVGFEPQSYYAQNVTLLMTDASITVNLPPRITPALSTLAANLVVPGVIYTGRIGTQTDPGTGSSWRQWYRGEDELNDSLSLLGSTSINVLYWRVQLVAGVPNIIFFPTWGDALASQTYTMDARVWISSATVVGGAKSFTLLEVQGAPANGSESI